MINNYINIDKDTVTLVIAIIGCVVGVSGLILGIYNLRRTIAKDKAALKVSTEYYISPSGERAIFIQVVNIGFIPVTIEQVGFEMKDERLFLATQLDELDGGPLPKQLHPQCRIRLHFQSGADTSNDFKNAIRSFARTAADDKFYGNAQPSPDAVTVYKTNRPFFAW